MTVTADDLVRREVHYCVSALVSTLANAYGAPTNNPDADQLIEQAMDLTASVPDFEEAAFQAGWRERDIVNRGLDRAWAHEADGPEGGVIYETARAVCECEELDWEDYNREVYEHWIVSDWLAEKLAAKGEKVDTDFAGLTVWARTTTGQGIASDSVIRGIVADLNKPESDA